MAVRKVTKFFLYISELVAVIKGDDLVQLSYLHLRCGKGTGMK